MVQKEKNLVILAAGIGSRFKGGIKQLQSVGPAGECIMDYSVYDALEAGFNRIVFIIRRDFADCFEEQIGCRVRRICEKYDAEVECVFQDINDLPGGFVCPEGRTKPWGTAHALLSCKSVLHGGFVVVNADDYYGKDAYRQMSEFLDTLEEDSRGRWAMAGFLLSNTLSDYGGVTRGLCMTNESGQLTSIVETKNILKDAAGPYVEDAEGVKRLDGSIPSSMNMWAFTPDVLGVLEDRFVTFLTEGGLENPKSEFLIPTEVGGMLSDGVKVSVLPTTSRWFGMTFSEETPMVRQALAQMTQAGTYPTPIF